MGSYFGYVHCDAGRATKSPNNAFLRVCPIVTQRMAVSFYKNTKKSSTTARPIYSLSAQMSLLHPPSDGEGKSMETLPVLSRPSASPEACLWTISGLPITSCLALAAQAAW
jgi:hypothetical protein